MIGEFLAGFAEFILYLVLLFGIGLVLINIAYKLAADMFKR
jgi:uncharacterized membrane protein